MKFEPLPHQKLMIEHLTNTPRALVFAGMGLGKTSSVISVVADRILEGESKGALIVAPLRVANLTWGQ